MKSGVWRKSRAQWTANDTALCVSWNLSQVHDRDSSWWHSHCPFNSTSTTTPSVIVNLEGQHWLQDLWGWHYWSPDLCKVMSVSAVAPVWRREGRGWTKPHLQCAPFRRRCWQRKPGADPESSMVCAGLVFVAEAGIEPCQARLICIKMSLLKLWQNSLAMGQKMISTELSSSQWNSQPSKLARARGWM